MPAFRAGDVHTGFIDEHLDTLLEQGPIPARSARGRRGGRARGAGDRRRRAGRGRPVVGDNRVGPLTP